MREQTRKNLDMRLSLIDDAEDEMSVRFSRTMLRGYIDALYDEERLSPAEVDRERDEAERRGNERLAFLASTVE